MHLKFHSLHKKWLNQAKYDAIITLGTVIRGSTPHFDYVCNEAAKGIAAISLNTGIPVIFGVLTTDTIEQAIERAGTKSRKQRLGRSCLRHRNGKPKGVQNIVE